MNQFWDNFVKLCEKSGITPTQAVEDIGVSRGSVTHWKYGKTPHPTTLRKLANFFNVTPELLLGTDSKKISLNRMRALCSEKGVSSAFISRKTGIDPLVISDDGDGKRLLRREDIQKIADILDTTVEYLAEETDYSGKPLSWADINALRLGLQPVHTRKIPLLGEIACGKPIFANEDRESYVSVGTDLKVDFCLRAKGDSMIGARILDGDIVFIQKCDMVNNGEIAAVVIDDEATLKRVYYYPEKSKLVLNAENPKYEPLVYLGDELNQIHILGRAVAFQSDVR